MLRLSLAASFVATAALIASARASDFTQGECKTIALTAAEVVRVTGREKLSADFRQSFINWLGKELTCDGPKNIAISTHQDSVTYRTIRGMLLSGSKPISLEKAGLRAVVREKPVP